MSRIVLLWNLVVVAAVVVIYTLGATSTSSYGRRDPCLRGNVNELLVPTSSGSSDLPAIPIHSLEVRGGGGRGARDRETVSVGPQIVQRSGFGTPRLLKRNLGEEEELNGGGNAVPSSGLRLFVSRRSSHPSSSEAKMHPVKLLQSSLERDLHRVNGLAKRVLFTSRPAEDASSSRSRFRTSFPDLTNPGGKKDQPTGQASSSNSTSGLYKFESTVKSGVSFGSGEYFADFYVGTPPRHFSVIIDTGSDLTWVQCDPCELCYRQNGPVFQPNLSSTYDGLNCAAENCKSAGGFGDDPDSCEETARVPGLCRYFYYYGDLSNTTGDFALETVTFHVSRGDPLQIEQILFGCGHSNIGLFQGAGGLLGLGQGPISFVSQVGSLFGDKFSYCLVDRDDPSYIGSPLIFGEDEIYKALQPKFQWTPLLKDTPVDTFYYVNITGVIVGGELLKIPETAWHIDTDGYGGTIIDSGTTLSYFRQDAYDAIKRAFVQRISYPVVTSVPVLSLCYNITGIQSPDFPSLSIVFQDSAIMDLPFKNYFIRPDPTEDVYCLALLGMPQKSLNIIGNFQQQNFHIVYDRGNARFGFTPVDCAGIL